MGKYIKLTMLYLVYLFISTVIAYLILVIMPIIRIILSFWTETTQIILILILLNAILCIFFYIIMHKNGYKRNNTYEKKPINELVIPIIISISLFTVINIVIVQLQPTSFLLASVLLNFSDYNDIEELFKNGHFIFPLMTFLYSILYAFFMILGYSKGYKKREKERKALFSKEGGTREPEPPL